MSSILKFLTTQLLLNSINGFILYICLNHDPNKSHTVQLVGVPLSLVHVVDFSPPLFLCFAVCFCENSVRLSCSVSHSLNFADSIPSCGGACSSLLCNPWKFVVESRGLIRFRLEIFGKGHFMGGCVLFE